MARNLLTLSLSISASLEPQSQRGVARPRPTLPLVRYLHWGSGFRVWGRRVQGLRGWGLGFV